MTVLRSILFMLFLALVTGVLGLGFFPLTFMGPGAARPIVKLWSKSLLFAARFLCGVRFRIEGAENIPKGGALIAANHQSMWETVAIFSLLDKPAVVLKKELLKIPVYGWWAKRNAITIDRGSGAKAIRTLKKETCERLKRGEQIVIFPEGTRGPPGELGVLQPGVAAMYMAVNEPVIPAVHNSGRYWKNPGPIKIPGVITLRFLKEIPAGLPRNQFMKALKTALSTDVESG